MKYPYSTLDITHDTNVATCSIDRPSVRNALNSQAAWELEDFFTKVARDTSVRSIILTGAGDAFCAGGDLEDMRTGDDEASIGIGSVFTDGGIKLIRSLVSIPQPIVAAINGDAIGLGATLALYCDICLMAEGARIGDPHVKVGLVAGDGGSIIWPLLVGANRAKAYLLTGKLASAEEAERIGLVNSRHDRDALYDDALALAHRMADLPAAAVQWTKRSINKVLTQSTDALLDMSMALEGLSSMTDDHKRIVASLLAQ